MPDTTKGDVVRLAMLEYSPLATDGGTFDRYMLTKSANLAPLRMLDHSSTGAEAVFEPRGVATPLQLDWRRSDFWDLAPAVYPQLLSRSWDAVYVEAMPFISTGGYYTAAPDLLYVYGTSKNDRTNLVIGGTPWNPYPASWDPVVFAQQCFYSPSVEVAPDAGSFLNLSGCVFGVELALKPAGHRISPRLSPPTNFAVDGQSPYQPRTLSSLTPRVSWSPPTTGAASSYTLIIRRVYPRKPGASVYTLAVFSTTGTSLVVPPDVLEAGEPYIFLLSAHSDPVSSNAAPFPYRSGFPESDAQTTSNVLRAPP